MTNKPCGKVILVGAGPGDAGLLTLAGKNWIERADVILYDHLVGSGILHFAKAETETIYVGDYGLAWGFSIVPEPSTFLLVSLGLGVLVHQQGDRHQDHCAEGAGAGDFR